MQIKELPAYERPQEKLLYYGAKSLSSSELLALILRHGNREKSAIELASEVISVTSRDCGGLDKASVEELTKISGIGKSKACAIVASIELSRRLRAISREDKPCVIRTAQDAVALLKEELEGEKREHLIELVVNAKLEVEAKLTISVGALQETGAGPREILCPAIKRGAAGIIIAHNHPSGDPSPSRNDIQATERIYKASQIIGIELIDHIIIGRNSYVSLREKGEIGKGI